MKIDLTVIILEILKYGITPVGLIILGMAIAFHYPEKIQKWCVFFWRVVRFLWKGAEKRIISNDIEGRVNDFSKSLRREIAHFEPVGIRIQWIENGESPEQFFNDNRLIIRMREHPNQNRNFVYAAMVFISSAVLTKVKKYISKTQKESIDLFIGKKLFEKEKLRVLDQFFDDFFSPKIDANRKIGDLIEKYNIIDKAGLFFPVFVQELSFLGGKVFFQRRDDRIIVEVRKFINFLKDCADREIGEEELPKNFEGTYCRCGITIIAKIHKRELGTIGPYTRYISDLIEKKIENIYLIGPGTADNMKFIDKIGEEIQYKGVLEKYMSRRYKSTIKISGERKTVKSYLVLFRNPNAIKYFDEEYQKKFIE